MRVVRASGDLSVPEFDRTLLVDSHLEITFVDGVFRLETVPVEPHEKVIPVDVPSPLPDDHVLFLALLSPPPAGTPRSREGVPSHTSPPEGGRGVAPAQPWAGVRGFGGAEVVAQQGSGSVTPLPGSAGLPPTGEDRLGASPPSSPSPRSGEEALGAIHLMPWWNGFAYVNDLIVDRAHRGHGVGTALLRAGIDWAREQSFPGVMLETQHDNVAACRFYEAHGFVLGGFDRMTFQMHKPGEVALYWYLVF